MVMGIDPKKLAAVQEISKHINASIELNFKTEQVILSLVSDVPEAKAAIPDLLEQFTNGLATQLSSFFAIKGEIEQVGAKPGETPQ